MYDMMITPHNGGVETMKPLGMHTRRSALANVICKRAEIYASML
jgi:hypothetical protein